MESYPTRPEPGEINVETLATVDVPQSEWSNHSLLRHAQLNSMGDALEWPSATFEQLPLLRGITLVLGGSEVVARFAGPFNFDFFVDATTDDAGPAQPLRHETDQRRFYTRVTANGFHVVGVFTAATIANRRRYFQWLTGAWVEIGLNGFLYVRDDFDTHFSEVSSAQLDETQPGATTTALIPEEEWTVETVQRKFVGEPAVEPAAPVARQSMFEPVIEALTVETFPTITPPNPESVVDLQPPHAAAVAPNVPEPVVVTPHTSVPKHVGGSATAESALESIEITAAVQRGIAVALATFAHRGGVDLVGAATIDHVARVAEAFDLASDHIRHCAAWLHDVLDRSDFTVQDLLDAGIQPEIVEIVSLLTQHDGVAADEWLCTIVQNPSARAIKLQAVTDNAAPWRLRKLDAATRAKCEREFAHELAILRGE